VIAGLLQRDRAITLASLLLLTALSWVTLIRGTGHAHGMSVDPAPHSAVPMPSAAPDPAHGDGSSEDEESPGYIPP
jgi:hypothetical protein